MESEKSHQHLTLGAASAAILSAAIGCFVIGLAALLAASSPEIKESLVWYEAAGSLSGESGTGIAAWLICWGFLHPCYKNRHPNMPLILSLSCGLIFLALIFLFPPVYHHFKPL